MIGAEELDTDIPQYSADYCLDSDENLENIKQEFKDRGQIIVEGSDARKVAKELCSDGESSAREMLTSPHDAQISNMERLSYNEIYVWLEPQIR